MESVCWGNSTVGSNPTLSANQSALVILRTTFHSKCGFSRAKCGDLHLCKLTVSLSETEKGSDRAGVSLAPYRVVEFQRGTPFALVSLTWGTWSLRSDQHDTGSFALDLSLIHI